MKAPVQGVFIDLPERYLTFINGRPVVPQGARSERLEVGTVQSDQYWTPRVVAVRMVLSGLLIAAAVAKLLRFDELEETLFLSGVGMREIIPALASGLIALDLYDGGRPRRPDIHPLGGRLPRRSRKRRSPPLCLCSVWAMDGCDGA